MFVVSAAPVSASVSAAFFSFLLSLSPRLFVCLIFSSLQLIFHWSASDKPTHTLKHSQTYTNKLFGSQQVQLIQSIFNNVINEWQISRLPHNGWLEHPDVNGAEAVNFDLQARREESTKLWWATHTSTQWSSQLINSVFKSSDINMIRGLWWSGCLCRRGCDAEGRKAHACVSACWNKNKVRVSTLTLDRLALMATAVCVIILPIADITGMWVNTAAGHLGVCQTSCFDRIMLTCWWQFYVCVYLSPKIRINIESKCRFYLIDETSNYLYLIKFRILLLIAFVSVIVLHEVVYDPPA